jgi:S-DNA-T family DNA segregation ATPase FtsK/SpoIIIE
MTWSLPPLDILEPHAPALDVVDTREDEMAAALTAAGLSVEKVQATIAPQLVRYSVRLAAGADPAKVERAMGAVELAIGARARFTGAHQGHVGIEVAREELSPVYLRETIERSDALIRLGFPLGEGVHGSPALARLADLPHLLVAGTTGSGKSVWLTSALISLLLRNTPDDMRLTLVDPKRVELAPFAGLPHLTGPILTEMGGVGIELRRLVDLMEHRFSLFEAAGVREIGSYNDQAADGERMARHVLVIDELADLLMQNKTAEPFLVRLLQKGRAAGIHAILATQRPAANVLTGLIRANVPARVVFAVQSHTDSKVALGYTGAERLRGQGDGLYQAPGVGGPVRFQAPMTSAADVERVVRFWQRQAAASAPAAAPAPQPVDEPVDDPSIREEVDAWFDEMADEPGSEVASLTPQEVLAEAGLSGRQLDALVELVAQRLSGPIIEKIAAGVADATSAMVLSNPANPNEGEVTPS